MVFIVHVHAYQNHKNVRTGRRRAVSYLGWREPPRYNACRKKSADPEVCKNTVYEYEEGGALRTGIGFLISLAPVRFCLGSGTRRQNQPTPW